MHVDSILVRGFTGEAKAAERRIYKASNQEGKQGQGDFASTSCDNEVLRRTRVQFLRVCARGYSLHVRVGQRELEQNSTAECSDELSHHFPDASYAIETTCARKPSLCQFALITKFLVLTLILIIIT